MKVKESESKRKFKKNKDYEFTLLYSFLFDCMTINKLSNIILTPNGYTRKKAQWL